jgi:hypothetical protein
VFWKQALPPFFSGADMKHQISFQNSRQDIAGDSSSEISHFTFSVLATPSVHHACGCSYGQYSCWKKLLAPLMITRYNSSGQEIVQILDLLSVASFHRVFTQGDCHEKIHLDTLQHPVLYSSDPCTAEG